MTTITPNTKIAITVIDVVIIASILTWVWIPLGVLSLFVMAIALAAEASYR